MFLFRWLGFVGSQLVAKRRVIGFATQSTIAACLVISVLLQMAIYTRLVALEKATLAVDVKNDAIAIRSEQFRGIPVRLVSHSISNSDSIPIELYSHSIGSFEPIPIDVVESERLSVQIDASSTIPVEIKRSSTVPVEIEGHSLRKAIPVEIE
ncbi:MAG: hypothetical protein RIC55_28200 [Pirellulaceae bacterium]